MKELANMIREGSGLVSIIFGSGFISDGIDTHTKILIIVGILLMVTGGVNTAVSYNNRS